MRELVSNASDALEKCRHDFMAKQDPGELAVAIKVDSDKGTFVIEDNGLGMSKDDGPNLEYRQVWVQGFRRRDRR